MNEIKAMAGGKLVGIKTSIFTIFNQEKYDARAIPEAWQAFFALYRESGLPQSSTFLGGSIPSMSADVPMDYYAGVLIAADTPTPAGMEEVNLPEGNYFQVTHHGPISELMGSYGRAYGVELPQSGAEMRNAPHLEIYESNKNPMDPDYEMIIAIPVQ